MKKLSYGIDFGTTNSTIAVIDESGQLKKLEVDPQASNPSVMRSVTYVSTKNEFLYGQPAVDAYLVDVSQGKGRTTKTIFTGRMIKLIGDADKEGAGNEELVPEIIEVEVFSGGRIFQALKSVLSSSQLTLVNIFGKEYAIEEMVGGFLGEMKTRADSLVGQKVDRVVLGRPVTFVGEDNKLAEERLVKAAKIAGFKHISLEYEPIGAAYEFGSQIGISKVALIFDFGGGTLDISVVSFPEKKVLANIGNPIGGDYFNSKIFTNEIASYFGKNAKYGEKQLELPSYIFYRLQNWFEATLLKTENFARSLDHFSFKNSDRKAMKALRSLINNNLSFSLYDEIDRVKKELTDKEFETFLFEAEDILINKKYKRVSFEKLIKHDLESIENSIDQALNQASFKPKNIDSVVTTGGSSLIPAVRQILVSKFGNEKIVPNDAFTSVGAGLALKASEIYS